MSGLVGPGTLDVALGLAAEIALKVTVPLALGLAASHLPGSAAARHLRLALALASVPVLAAATVALRGDDAAFTAGGPVWPLAGWLLGAGLVGGGLLVGLWRLHRLPTTRTPEGLEVVAGLESPATAGWWRPRILVPAGFAEWPAPARSAALAHERAHVRRRDWAVHVAAGLLGATLWFHPLAAIALRRLALLAECAADDEVIALGHDPAGYAELLLRLGRSAPTVALPLGPSAVGIRVRRLLAGVSPGRPSAARASVVAAVLAASVAATAPRAAWHAPAPVDGCSPAPAATAPALEEVPPPPLADAVARMEALADRVPALPPEERREAARAAAVLATNCPYNRATFQLLLVLERELSALDDHGLDAGERERLALLLRGVRAQVEVAREVGADELPLPLVVDYLAGDYVSGPLVTTDGPSFAASRDPLGETEALVEQVPAWVERMPAPTHAAVEQAWTVLGRTVPADDWFRAVSAWAGAFETLAPAFDGPSSARALRLRALLRTHGRQGC